MILDDKYIDEIKTLVPELPIEKRLRYLEEYKLSDDDARLLTTSRDLSDYYDNLVSLTKDPKKSCSYITTILLAMINESEEIKTINDLKFDITQLSKVIELVNKDELSSTNSKDVIAELFENG
ncbi:MAG: hypothetical protein P1U46_01570 [Patescibacteria group bacterium]|nr:hypothetical protein [Patescibacteria group bacterium]